MIADTNIFGVFFSGALTAASIASIVLLILRHVLRRIGFYRLVWHGNLVDIALFTILWCLTTFLLPIISGAIS